MLNAVPGRELFVCRRKGPAQFGGVNSHRLRREPAPGNKGKEALRPPERWMKARAELQERLRGGGKPVEGLAPLRRPR